MKIITFENSLQTQNPELAAQWHPIKNGKLTPHDVSPGSNRKAWWICDKGHEWEATISNRNIGKGCPYCSNHRLLKGYNDLATIKPELVKEWNTEKNGDLTPDMFMAFSHQTIWWKCQFGHEWETKISNRSNGRGCPQCIARYQSSFPEQAVFFYIKQVFQDAINRYQDIFSNGMELDIYISSLKTGIEYDGLAWHGTKGAKEREEKKNQICLQHGINLLRIKETKDEIIKPENGIFYIHKEPSFREIDSVINELLEYFGIERIPEIDSEKDEKRILSEFLSELKNNSLAIKAPSIAKEWHPSKNGDLTPYMFAPHTRTKIWWECEKGHEWQAAISDRNKGDGCPYCSGQRVLTGFNDLETLNTKLSQEWHPTKNMPLLPSQVTLKSNKTVWWKCDKGHEWQTKISNRANGKGCPFCSGRNAITGITDLKTVRPDLAEEWNYEKNLPLTPNNVSALSHHKVWWKCDKGHEWQAAISDRNRERINGCPYCSNHRVLKGFNDLATVNPALANEWNNEKNGFLTPSDVTGGSNQKVWWKCEKGHEWQAIICSRTKGNGCPYCSGKLIIPGVNDLATKNPKLAEEWHPNRNGELTPSMIAAGSGKKVWWLCRNGHEWEAIVDNRNKGRGCPYCSGKRKLNTLL